MWPYTSCFLRCACVCVCVCGYVPIFNVWFSHRKSLHCSLLTEFPIINVDEHKIQILFGRFAACSLIRLLYLTHVDYLFFLWKQTTEKGNQTTTATNEYKLIFYVAEALSSKFQLQQLHSTNFCGCMIQSECTHETWIEPKK